MGVGEIWLGELLLGHEHDVVRCVVERGSPSWLYPRRGVAAPSKATDSPTSHVPTLHGPTHGARSDKRKDHDEGKEACASCMSSVRRVWSRRRGSQPCMARLPRLRG